MHGNLYQYETCEGWRGEGRVEKHWDKAEQRVGGHDLLRSEGQRRVEIFRRRAFSLWGLPGRQASRIGRKGGMGWLAHSDTEKFWI